MEVVGHHRCAGLTPTEGVDQRLPQVRQSHQRRKHHDQHYRPKNTAPKRCRDLGEGFIGVGVGHCVRPKYRMLSSPAQLGAIGGLSMDARIRPNPFTAALRDGLHPRATPSAPCRFMRSRASVKRSDGVGKWKFPLAAPARRRGKQHDPLVLLTQRPGIRQYLTNRLFNHRHPLRRQRRGVW